MFSIQSATLIKLHKILFRVEKDLSTFAVPRGSSNSRVAALENAGNMAHFSTDNMLSTSLPLVMTGHHQAYEESSVLWLVHKGQDSEGLQLV